MSERSSGALPRDIPERSPRRGRSAGPARRRRYARGMGETETQKTWRGDARVLGEVGAVLLGQSLPQVEVRLPRRLAEQAVAAWERDDGGGPLEPETSEQAARRLLAGTLALIGLSITERGRWEGDEVVVELDPALIGPAVDAADRLPSN